MQQQKTNELLKVYFRSSQSDVLKNVNPAEMSEKSITKLLKTSQKNGFTELDIVKNSKPYQNVNKKADAETIISGTPQNTAVLEGHTISKYGHPNESGNWVGGSKIIYLDGNGNVILNGMNNIKDCIVMAYVIMDGDFDSNEVVRNDLITDLWETMNLQVTYEESDIITDYSKI